MPDLRIEPAGPDDEAAKADWRRIHNLIIPTATLSAEEVDERSGRNRLAVAYLDAIAVGCSTVRAPTPEGAVTVIARILPEYRRRGHGERLYREGLAVAHQRGARSILTVVLASNEDGLRFALRHGFVEIGRYVLPGDTIPFVDLRLASWKPGDPSPPLDGSGPPGR